MRNSAFTSHIPPPRFKTPGSEYQRVGFWDLRSGCRDSRAERGISLVEASIILMVVSILAAVIAPSISEYVGDAQDARARTDTQSIAAAMTRMLTDVGEAWFLRDGSRTGSATDHGAPSHAAGVRVDMLVSDGAIPTLSATPRASGTDWDDPLNHAAVQSLHNYLATNRPSNLAGNAYRSIAGMDGSGNFDPGDGRTGNAEYAWRGAYVPAPVAGDPWGNRYAANVEFLARTQGTPGSGSQMDVIVLSAGPDWEIDTVFETDGTTSAQDDIAALVSGGTR